MKWVTREKARVDRIACPWLISRFIDREATFLFVPRDQVMQVAEREGAIPYDVPGVELGHHGERCSFDAFLEKYKLDDPALHALTGIVRGADTDARQDEKSTSFDTAERVKQIRMWLPAQMREERLEAARLHYGPLYTLNEIRRRGARTLRWRLGFTRGAVVEPVEKYVARIPDETLLKYGDAIERGLFSRFWVVTPRYYSLPEADPWIVGEVIGSDLCAIIAQW